MRTLEKDLEIFFGGRLEPLSDGDVMPTALGSVLGKLVEAACTFVFCTEGFSVTTQGGVSVELRYGDSQIERMDLRALAEANRTGVGSLVIRGPVALSLELPAPVLVGLMTVARWGC